MSACYARRDVWWVREYVARGAVRDENQIKSKLSRAATCRHRCVEYGGARTWEVRSRKTPSKNSKPQVLYTRGITWPAA